MQYCDRFKVGKTVYYTVYNSKGDLALITSNFRLAEILAEAFRANPHCTEIRVGDLAPDRVKRV